MKIKILTSLIFVSFLIKAQPPQGINYQGVARDANGHPLVNQNIGIKLSILDSSITGQVIYVETHNVITNSFGLFNLGIGLGNVVLGNFSNIPWGQGDKWLQIEMDISGGNNYQLIATTQFFSVPYALCAEKLAASKYSEDQLGPFELLFFSGISPPYLPIATVPNGKVWVIKIHYNVLPEIYIGTIFGEWWLKSGDQVFSKPSNNNSLDYYLTVQQYDTCNVHVKTYLSPGTQMSVCIPSGKIWKLAAFWPSGLYIQIPNVSSPIGMIALQSANQENPLPIYYFDEGTCFENIGTQPMFISVLEFNK